MGGAILKSVLSAVLDSFGSFLADLVKTWQTNEQNQEIGRREQAGKELEAAAKVRAELMDELAREPSETEVLERLRQGTA